MKPQMKKVFVIALALALLLAVTVLPASAAYLSTGNFDILITEICVSPSQELAGGFGQLIEIYNNTDGVLDLNDYELMIASGRATNKQFVEGEQFKGLIKPVLEGGKITLSSGELAVIWVVFNDAQKSATEETVRTAMNIPAATQIVRVDTTDSACFYGEENHLATDTRYLMVNKRGCFDKNKGQALDAYVDGEDTGRGAYVRVYGVDDGTSQFFGTPVNASNTKVLNWQSDGATAKSYDTPNFGRLTKNDNINQYEQIKGVPGVDYNAPDTTTPAPVETTPSPAETTPAPADTTTAAPATTPEDTTEAPAAPSEDTTPKDTTTAAPKDTTTTAPEKGGCGSSAMAGGVMTLAFALAAYVVAKKK